MPEHRPGRSGKVRFAPGHSRTPQDGRTRAGIGPIEAFRGAGRNDEGENRRLWASTFSGISPRWSGPPRLDRPQRRRATQREGREDPGSRGPRKRRIRRAQSDTARPGFEPPAATSRSGSAQKGKTRLTRPQGLRPVSRFGARSACAEGTSLGRRNARPARAATPPARTRGPFNTATPRRRRRRNQTRSQMASAAILPRSVGALSRPIRTAMVPAKSRRSTTSIGVSNAIPTESK